MKRNASTIIIIITGLLLAISLVPENPLHSINWALFSAIIVGLAIVAYFWHFESSTSTTGEIAFLATMASLAAISRIPFTVIMSLQPTTFVVMITGYVFGPQAGFMVGAAAALVSNFFLGQGPWTPWQMFCWGMCGVAAALLARRHETFSLPAFTVLAGLCGYLFGWVMNIWHWVGFIYPLTWTTFLATYAASFPFDTIHAAGNVVFSIIFGKAFYVILSRFRKKMTVRYDDMQM
ncbi:MAG: ECF transporter S component [Syntrophothermaceae bacterium]|jgi:energy-coupling factor transport system substrate-specific component